MSKGQTGHHMNVKRTDLTPQECQKDRLDATGTSKGQTTHNRNVKTGHHRNVKKTDWTPYERQKDRLDTHERQYNTIQYKNFYFTRLDHSVYTGFQW